MGSASGTRVATRPARPDARHPLHEPLGAEEAELLAVVNEDLDRVREFLVADDARDLERRGDADAVVRRAGAGGDGVVVNGEEDRRTGFVVRAGRDDVLDLGAERVRAAGETLGVLHTVLNGIRSCRALIDVAGEAAMVASKRDVAHNVEGRAIAAARR